MSQSTIEGRQGSSACFVIAFLLARQHLLQTGPQLPPMLKVKELMRLQQQQPKQEGEPPLVNACDERWGEHLRSCILNGNKTYDLVQGRGKFFDFDDIKVRRVGKRETRESVLPNDASAKLAACAG
jgi:hypothetical protein